MTTKAQFLKMLCRDTNLSLTQTERFHEAYLDRIELELRAGHEVHLSGFGSFSILNKKARKARNPQTGAEVDVPAKRVVKFKPATALNDGLGVPL